jgi:hypothetical protein
MERWPFFCRSPLREIKLGLWRLRLLFFLLLTVMLVAYLLVLAVEGMKQWFFRHFATE